jgi:hypothetical protein
VPSGADFSSGGVCVSSRGSADRENLLSGLNFGASLQLRGGEGALLRVLDTEEYWDRYDLFEGALLEGVFDAARD